MSISQVPPEIQFRYLLDLPFQDVLRYCRTHKEAYQICQSDFFWEQKALRDYRISLKILDSGSGVEKYSQLKEDYENSPLALIIPLLRADQTDLITDLLKKEYYFNEAELGGRVKWLGYFQHLSDIIKDAYYLGPEKFQFLLDSIKKIIKPEDWSGLTDALRILFIQAIRDGQPELIEPYYDYRNDDQLEFAYYDAMNEGDLAVVKYLHPLIEPLIGPAGEMAAAVKSGDQAIIDYFIELYPGLLGVDFVNDLVEECLQEENFKSVWILSQMFPQLINLDRAIEVIRREFPKNSLEMRQAYNALSIPL